MVIFPNCKINLGLHILQKRNDGYHDLETVFYPIPVYDVLEIISSKTTQFNTTGIPINVSGDNLCIQAYRLLKNDYPQLPEVNIHLHKVIHIGAGLGGGSADAAFTLILLNKKYNLGISDEKLFGYALQLGSDCPIFILNKPALAKGRGEVLEEINCTLSPYKMLLINPGIHINTGELFGKITPSLPKTNLREIIQLPVSEWKHQLTNDFEKIVFAEHPVIEGLKKSMYENGAVYAAMTGTGSSVFGLFHEEVDFATQEGYFKKWIAFN